MKKLICVLMALALLFSLYGCSGFNKTDEAETIPVTVPEEEGRGNEPGTFSKELLPIPQEYYNPASSSVPSEELSYTHGDHTKSAVVYLPPDYSEENEYNVLYILGGVSADETAFFNSAGSEATLKNILDNMILNGDIQPCIVVNLAFYPYDDVTLGDMSLTYMLDDFEEELRDVIIPAVESKYSTYAKSTDPDGIVKSRKHRAFSGFSMGGAVAWYTFTQNLDCFYYLAPMAAGSFEDYDNDTAFSVGSELNKKMGGLGYRNDEFFIFASEGTADVTYEKMEVLMERFRNDYPQVFVFTDDNKAEGNITYKTKANAEHEYANAYEYIYNSLLCFWG